MGGSRGSGPGGFGTFNPQGRDEVKLYVGNLSFDTNEEGVRNMFEAHGAVTDCFLPTDRDTGRPRGFAFVTMPAKDAEAACAKVNGLELDGRTIRVNEAQPKGEYIYKIHRRGEGDGMVFFWALLIPRPLSLSFLTTFFPPHTLFCFFIILSPYPSEYVHICKKTLMVNTNLLKFAATLGPSFF